MRTFTKSIAVFIGLTAFGMTSYMLYLLLKNDEEDELLDKYSYPNKYKIMEMKIPKDIVRSLIGRNGSNIKQIQERTETRINFKDREGLSEKICVIKGSADCCKIACQMIQDFINNQPVFEVDEYWVPVGFVRKIIGHGGEQINQINSLSGAKLNIINDEKKLSSKRIIIKGTREQINVARSLIDEVIEQCQHNQSVIEESLSKREPRHPAKSADVLIKVEKPKYERMSPVPGQQDNQFEVYVSAMETPSKFWLQIVGPKATELDCLVDEMTDYYGKLENQSNHTLYEVNPGDLVAAVFKYDKKWYRAEVLDVFYEDSTKMAKLLYVDYGDSDKLPCDDLFELRTDLLRLHFQAIECFLARVEPTGSTWSEEAKDRFEELAHVAQWKKLSARIHGYSLKEKTRANREGSPVPGVELYNVNNDQDINVAEELVKEGHAVFRKGAELRPSSRAASNSSISVSSSS